MLVWLGASPSAAAQSVTTYHGAASRSGMYVAPTLTWLSAPNLKLDTSFNASVEGQVYAQPLYWVRPDTGAGQVIVATEANNVYALDGATGAVAWRQSLGLPVALDALPCGNINPIGITGTPVIDPATQILYVSALVNGTGPQHAVYAFSLVDGTPVPGWPVNVAEGLARFGYTFDPTVQGQRSALTLVNGHLYVTYAGNAGDCGAYHGWVVGLDVLAGQIDRAWVTLGQGGGIWSQGGLAYDGTSLYMATGNTKGVSTWSHGEGVFRLGESLLQSTDPADYFTPLNWLSLDKQDLDLGSTTPVPVDVPLPTGTLNLLLALGKNGKAYLLNRGHLGGLDGQLAMKRVAIGGLRTAPAVYTFENAALVAFQGAGSDCPVPQASANLIVLRIAADANRPISTAWCGAFAGGGAPIVTTSDGVADPIVWVVGAEGDAQLHGFRGSDGAPLFTSAPVLGGLHHFQTLLVGGNHLYIGADGTVYAFKF